MRKEKKWRGKWILILIISLSQLSGYSGFAQKQTTRVTQAWFGYLNQTRLSDKWGFWLDAHLRTKEKLATNFSTSIVRLGLTYYLADNSKLTVGYAWINNFPGRYSPGSIAPGTSPLATVSVEYQI